VISRNNQYFKKVACGHHWNC